MSLSAILFAGMNFLAHLASGHVAWSLVAGSRASIGVLVAVAVARVRGVSFIPRSTPTMWLRSVFGTLSLGCTFYAVGSRAIALGDAVTLVNLSPVLLALMAPIVLHEHAGRRVAMALPLSVAGVILILKPSLLFGGGAAHAGLAFPASVAVFASFFSAFAMMMLRRVGRRESPEAIAMHFGAVAAVSMLLLSIPRLAVPSGIDIVTILGAGMCGGFAQLAMTRAYSLEYAARVSPFGYISVLASTVMGGLALHEWPDRLALLGMVLIVSGGLVVSIAAMRDAGRRKPNLDRLKA